jgi:hypothetical protein
MDEKFQQPTFYLIGVKESNGDVTSGLTRPQAAEIVFPTFSTIRKALITSKRYKIDGNCQQNTNRKPWSLYRLATSTSGLKRPLAVEIDILHHNRQSKNG